MKTRTINVVKIILLGTFGLANSSRGVTVFWTDVHDGPNSMIRRSDENGTSVMTLVTGLKHPRGMALDLPGGKLYWNEPGLPAIRRINLDGSGAAETLVGTDDSSAGVALDIAAGKMYWTSFGGNVVPGKIRRANLDGTNPEDLITNALSHPVGIALDVLRGKMYWTELEGNLDGTGSIKRANLDGSIVESLVSGIDEANGLAIDPDGGKIYWPELTTRKIQSANLDGTGVQDLITNLSTPTAVALDLVERKVYWTDSSNGVYVILRANLDGSEVQTVVSEGFPWGIAVGRIPRVALIKAVKPSFSDLTPGSNYQLQISPDTLTWTNHGSAFTATNQSMGFPQYWDVENWNSLFFRLRTF